MNKIESFLRRNYKRVVCAIGIMGIAAGSAACSPLDNFRKIAYTDDLMNCATNGAGNVNYETELNNGEVVYLDDIGFANNEGSLMVGQHWTASWDIDMGGDIVDNRALITKGDGETMEAQLSDLEILSVSITCQ